MRKLLWSLFVFVASAGQANPEVCLQLACYHYEPKEPYVDPQHKPLFSSVVAHLPVCGVLNGKFLQASPKLDFQKVEKACQQEIPHGTRILRMRAATKAGKEYILSFEDSLRHKGLFKRIVVFGDSLSEEGKAISLLQKLQHPITGAALSGVAKLIGCPVPKHFLDFGLKPYWNGAFSNGPIWPRYLSHFLDDVAIDNQSFGGATTGARKCRLKHLQKMVKRHLRDNVKDNAIPDNLYVIWLGGNNYFFADGVSPVKITPKERIASVERAVKELADAVNLLFSRGARHIVLLTIPNPKESPSWQFCDDSTCFESHKREWRESVALHNNLLRERVAQMGAGWGHKVSLFDVDLIVQNEAAQLALDTHTLWKFERERFNREEVLQKVGFFDAVHPTTKVHCIIAQKLVNHLVSEGFVDSKFKPLDPNLCDKKVEEFAG